MKRFDRTIGYMDSGIERICHRQYLNGNFGDWNTLTVDRGFYKPGYSWNVLTLNRICGHSDKTYMEEYMNSLTEFDTLHTRFSNFLSFHFFTFWRIVYIICDVFVSLNT